METKSQAEKIITSAIYGGYTIHMTSLGNYLVEIDGAIYKVGSLQDAKEMIDTLNKTRRN